MRIISGKFKGRQLVGFKAKNIRPTSDRVKESIFNKIQPYLDSARVLDLFTGTGNLSIESLSRGADHVTSVESHPKSIQIIRENMQLLGIEKTEMKVIKQDVLAFLRSYSAEPFQVIIIDPPFTKAMAHDVMSQLAQSQAYGADSLVVIESSSQERIDDEYPPLKLLDRKAFGDKSVSYFQSE